MASRFFLFCLIIGSLQGCKTPVSSSVEPVPEVPPKEQEVPKMARSSAIKLEITADDVQQDDEKGAVIFTGNVDMKHPDFRLRCDDLLILMEKGETEPGIPFKQAIAVGKRVVMERINVKGVKQLGLSRKVVFNPRTGDIILSGGRPSLQSGKVLIKTTTQNAIIILKKDGSHSVIENNGGGSDSIGVIRKSGTSSKKE